MSTYPETLTISITQEQIDSGGHHVSNCPAALAFMAALRSRGIAVSNVNVYLQAFAWHDADSLPTYDVSRAAVKWIRAYDQPGSQMAPATFRFRRQR